MNGRLLFNQVFDKASYVVMAVGAVQFITAEPAMASGIEGVIPATVTAPAAGRYSEDELGRRFGRFMGSFLDHMESGRPGDSSAAETGQKPSSQMAESGYTDGRSRQSSAPAWPPYDPWGVAGCYGGQGVDGRYDPWGAGCRRGRGSTGRSHAMSGYRDGRDRWWEEDRYYSHDRPRYGGYYGGYGDRDWGRFDHAPRSYRYDPPYRDDRFDDRWRYDEDRYRGDRYRGDHYRGDRFRTGPFDWWGGGGPWDWWSTTPWW
ncbi:MAG: hypothetical protein HQL58_00700 [Magnetococcales bacterium]|nr:hypothetical protein [Magnetococcales bacterium]